MVVAVVVAMVVATMGMFLEQRHVISDVTRVTRVTASG